MYKALIFDLDGTLLNTLEDLADSVNEVLLTMDYPKRELNEFRQMVGNGFYLLLQRALPDNVKNDESICKRAVDLFREAYSRRYLDKTIPYPGIEDLISDLSKENIPMAVNSNKNQKYTEVLIDKFFPANTFRCIIGESTLRPKKPDPAGVYEILRSLGTSPVETLFIGDSSVDMITGKNAGLDTAGVSWGFRSVEELKENGAKYIINSPEEILKVAKGYL